MTQPWQAEPDIQSIRESVNSHIYTLFQKRKPGGQNQWSEKLPDFVKRLEAALFNSASTKEEYSDYGTLEVRLQDVARRLVHRPSSTPSSSAQGAQGAAGVLSNGAFDAVSSEPQPGPQQAASVGAGLAAGSTQLMESSAGIPAPSGAPGGPDGVSVKAEGVTTPPNGMVPLEAAGGAVAAAAAPPLGAADPGAASSAYAGMVPVGGGGPQQASALMSNGAPVLIKQDHWGGNPSPSMVPTSGGGAGSSGGMMPSSAPAGFMPTNAAGGGSGGGGMMMMPNNPGSSGVGHGGMMPSPALMGGGMMPNPGGSGGGGMVPSSSMGMVPGMIPNMIPSSSMGMPSPAVGAGGMANGGMWGLTSPGQQQQQLMQQQDPAAAAQQLHNQQMQAMLQQQQQQQQQLMNSTGMIPVSGAMAPPGGAPHTSNSPALAGFSLADAPDGSQAADAAAAAAAGVGGQQQMAGQLQQQLGGQQQAPGGMVPQQQQQQPQVGKSLDDRQQYIQKQQRWLLFLRHCAKCQQTEEECQFSRSCRVGKELWTHILQCNNPKCEYPRCTSSKDLLKHHQKCTNTACPICTPVKEYVRRTRHQGGGGGMSSMSPSMGGPSGGPAQPCSSATSAPPPGAAELAAMQQQSQAAAAQQQQQQQQQGMLGLKRSASNMMDPAAAAAMPAGMMQMPGGGMMGGMMQQQQQMAPYMQQQMMYGQQAYGMQQPYGMQQMQAGYPQQMAFPRQAALQQQYGQQAGGYAQQQYGQQQQQQQAYMQQAQAQQQVQQQMGYGQPGMGGVPGMMHGGMGNGLQNGMLQPAAATAAAEDTSKRPKPEADKRALLAKNTGTSLLECFEAHEIRSHVEFVYQTAQATKTPAQQPINPGDDCKVCGLTKLTFEPPCLYCTQCGQRIKRGQTYHCTVLEPGCEFRGFWCHGCLQEHKSDRIPWEGSQTGVVFKKDLQKKKNDDEIEEGWVQCDACEAWVHQICALFNKGKNDQNVHYLCPNCLVTGLEQGQRERIQVRPQAMLEGKDLPQNALGALLEHRVNGALQMERAQRAAMMGKMPHEVPTADSLTVRVINNVIKKCEVKPKFHEAFSGDGYPEAFKYRQRVVLLFQKIDGVDVALYCMYVQEYGADCPPPNRNCVYLSYIDSVKYFRPELQAANGVSLRTFVYHQILQGYLAFAKGLGFEQMFIWACPPLAGDDYILYCHPSKQKTPRSDRLRAWYHDMLRKARDEGTVAHVTTLWDSFFEGGRDHRYDKPSVTHIPYLEGDYWPGEAENLLASIADGQRSAGTGGNTALSRKAGGSKGKRYGSGPATTDEALLSRLGDILGGNMKEDFMLVHLQEPCSFCRRHVQGGTLYRYVPNGAGGSSALARPPPERRFEGIRLESPGPAAPAGALAHLQLCEGCYSTEAARVASGAKSRLPGSLTLADLMQQMVPPVQPVQDTDPDMGSEFFETRQAFLSLCQGNHYQFDSLRRAKHSSMMVLYHLHNPEAPAFSSTCNFCHVEIEPGTGLRCTVCSDFDMCGNCQAQGMRHEHPMVATTDFAKRDEMRMRLTEQERIERNQQLQKTLALLVHACSCHDPNCSSTSCRKVRQLFQHAVQCQQKVTGGCHLCKKMWCLLNLHAKSCTTSNCPVPRCRELKELRRRQQAHLETKRRAAYSNMMRNQGNK